MKLGEGISNSPIAPVTRQSPVRPSIRPQICTNIHDYMRFLSIIWLNRHTLKAIIYFYLLFYSLHWHDLSIVIYE